MNPDKQSARPQPAARQASSTSVSPAVTPMALLNRRLGNAGMRGILQAKLSVSDPQDPFEEEADRVAEQVMRMPEARTVARSPLQIQRSEDSSGAAPTVDAATASSIASLSSRGNALPQSVRAFMEPRFQANFGGVRIHDDAHAHDLARTVQAKAFTVGHDVVFGAGHYLPESESGRRLLAHELTHVLQQGQGRSSAHALQRSPRTPAAAPTPVAPQWLGRYAARAVHVRGDIWEVKFPKLGRVWVGPYGKLQYYIDSQGFGGSLEAAHIVGGEHLEDTASLFSYNAAPCVALDKSLHAKLSKATTTYLKDHLGGRATSQVGRTKVTIRDVRGAYDEVYSDFPELREMVREILRSSMRGDDGHLMPKATGAAMPPSSKPIDAHSGSKVSEPTSPMNAHEGGMPPKRSSPMDAHQGTTMPKPGSPMDAHRGTTMPKPGSPMPKVASGSVAAGVSVEVGVQVATFFLNRYLQEHFAEYRAGSARLYSEKAVIDAGPKFAAIIAANHDAIVKAQSQGRKVSLFAVVEFSMSGTTDRDPFMGSGLSVGDVPYGAEVVDLQVLYEGDQPKYHFPYTSLAGDFGRAYFGVSKAYRDVFLPLSGTDFTVRRHNEVLALVDAVRGNPPAGFEEMVLRSRFGGLPGSLLREYAEARQELTAKTPYNESTHKREQEYWRHVQTLIDAPLDAVIAQCKVRLVPLGWLRDYAIRMRGADANHASSWSDIVRSIDAPLDDRLSAERQRFTWQEGPSTKEVERQRSVVASLQSRIDDLQRQIDFLLKSDARTAVEIAGHEPPHPPWSRINALRDQIKRLKEELDVESRMLKADTSRR
jgi:uncharacterized protein DUF4157